MLLYINNLILFVLCVFWLNKNVVYYYLYIFYFYFDIVICDWFCKILVIVDFIFIF